ncbi:MAG: malonate-semialdehyde dehydrogenase (acetylating) / methylmalonate-semialdehyde dehydrogenase [Planctomycetota bacterium]|nr:MAG: malonate-semialdehyde dehydrogenase (acetylating) / methylmalonate-semialdehyde dehydrogenase [Planctomycetota bacterium]
MSSSAVPILIGERWFAPNVTEWSPVFNPSRGEEIARVPQCGAAEVDAVVQTATTAFASWSKTPAPARAAKMFAFKAKLETHFEELAALITRENGKTLEEARGDVRRGIEVVDFACGISHLCKGENLPQVADGIDGVTMREPIGVCAGITPFNFPAMVPLWMFPIAVACGNTFILKPSEKVPLTAVRLAELALEAGWPPGVLNLVHGGREAVDALLEHPGIAAISFVGSTRVAEHVYVTGCRQRCMAGSILMGVGDAAPQVRDRIAAAIDKLVLDDTSSNPKADMGPVIDSAARDRIQRNIETGIGEGAVLVRGGQPDRHPHGFFVAPTLFEQATPEMHIVREEIFGPVLTMLHPRDLDEAIAWANRSSFGNGAVIFTNSGGAARQFAREVRCGMVGVNVGVPAPMAAFAFSGWNRSFFGDLHVQGTEGVMFYTRQKIVLSRWDNAYRRTQGW